MSFLLDTVILSKLRKRERNTNVVHWLRETRASDLFLSVVTIGEIERGINRQQRVDLVFAKQLSSWLESILLHYRDRIIPIDIPIARRWGELSDRHGHASVDLLIAATAMEHGLTVMTRNVRHFKPTGVPIPQSL